MTVTPDLHRRARLWRDQDPDPDTRAELDALLDAGDDAALAERFAAPLAFGTAGLRGLRGPGPARMNRLLVRRVTAAVAGLLRAEVADAAERGVVVGFDARPGSRAMALDTAMVLAGAGIRVRLFPDYAPTPLVAFAALELGTAAAVVLTASHNPPAYNGYKLYWENGAPIVPPVDDAVAAALAALPLEVPIPLRERDEAMRAGLWQEHGDDLARAYLAAIRRPARNAPLRVVYSAMHGVAGALARRALLGQGIEALHDVASQSEPDGRFPAVRSPNPEDTEALEDALAEVRRVGADLVLANDPDGDRLAVAVADGQGDYLVLSGDQTGCLLADHLLREMPAAERRRGFVLNTLVSSPLLGRIAAGHGVAHEQTLTGFKWIWQRALEREAAGERLLFAYEDAIGFAVNRRVRDKDGIAAAVAVCELARACRAEGVTVPERLAALHRRYGLSCTRRFSLALTGPEAARRLDERLRTLRATPPAELAGCAVQRVYDYRTGRRFTPDGSEQAPIAPPAQNLLQLDLDGGLRVSIRPSGTERKLKIYLESLGDPGAHDLDAARDAAERHLDALAEALRRRLEA